MNDQDIIEPQGVTNTDVIMVISGSPVYRDTLQTYLLDLKYRIAGPFVNVDQAHTFLRKIQPDLIVFDAMTTQNELISFSTMLKNETKDMPVLILHNGESFTIVHDEIDFIFPPLNPNDIEVKVAQLLNHEIDEEDEVNAFIYFINKVLNTLLELSPEYGKIDIEEIIRNALNTLKVRNSDMTEVSEESIRISITSPDDVDLDSLIVNFKMVLEEIIEEIDSRLEAEWGQSLIEDTLESVTIELKTLPHPAIEIVEDLGKGYESIIKKFKRAVPDLDENHRKVIVTKLLLTDFGPELIKIVGDDDQLKDVFDENIASQLLTLVGQGSSYHQGIFGPVPLPKTDDVIAIIWSKLIASDIQDERMQGKTLVIVCIAFRKVIVNLIPPLDKLKKIFSEVDEFDHESSINQLTLEKILEQFKGNLL